MNNFFNDSISDEDYLGYKPYIEAFNYILENCDELISPPFIFGIHGHWGSGKSTFMNLIEKRISMNNRRFYIIKINPWEYGTGQNFITIFLAKLYEQVENEIEFKGDKSAIDFIKAIFKPLKLSFQMKPINIEYDFEKFELDEQKKVISQFITENFALKKSITYILQHKFIEKKKIVVFIDDLDRCDVDKVMEVIESIKLIFNSDNCIFFIGCDINYLERSLSIKYKDFFADKDDKERKTFSRDYLEKIIQIPFYITSIDSDSMKRYIKSIVNRRHINNKQIKISKDLFNNFQKSININLLTDLIMLVQVNPRKVKRIINLTFLNYIFMIFKAIEVDDFEVNINLLMFLCFIREVDPDFYRKNMTRELFCRATFEKYFTSIQDEKKGSLNEEEELIDDKNEDDNDILRVLFDKYYRYSKVNTLEKLQIELKQIKSYISVSNLNTINGDVYSEWGELADIRSQITNKKLSNFLIKISENKSVRNFVFWFFNDLYKVYENKIILGIVKNVNVYIGNTLNSRRWIFKLEYNINKNVLYIIFRWASKSYMPLEDINYTIKYKGYDNENERIQIDEETTIDELNQIKDEIYKYTITYVKTDIN